mmetsp:Transcript_18704/g.59248  ORF Transcript_18704/g.59248 Transcript_18704/m.59248 type:complete len:207 (+) Transcript_18704:782-1402(+)
MAKSGTLTSPSARPAREASRPQAVAPARDALRARAMSSVRCGSKGTSPPWCTSISSAPPPSSPTSGDEEPPGRGATSRMGWNGSAGPTGDGGGMSTFPSLAAAAAAAGNAPGRCCCIPNASRGKRIVQACDLRWGQDKLRAIPPLFPRLSPGSTRAPRDGPLRCLSGCMGEASAGLAPARRLRRVGATSLAEVATDGERSVCASIA